MNEASIVHLLFQRHIIVTKVVLQGAVQVWRQNFIHTFYPTNVFIVPYIHLPHLHPSKNKNTQNKTVQKYSRQIQVTTVNDHKSLKLKNITNNKNQLKWKLNKRPSTSKLCSILYDVCTQNR